MREVLVDNDIGKLEVEWFEGVPLLHLRIDKWSHNIFKKRILPLWGEALDHLRSKGCHVVLAVIPEKDKKIARFHALLGMHEAVHDQGYIISRRWL